MTNLNKRCKLCRRYEMFPSKTRDFYIQELEKTNLYNNEVLQDLCIHCLKKEYEFNVNRKKFYAELNQIMEGEKHETG